MNRPSDIRRRSAAALILAFLLISAALAPVAYRMGRAQGAALAADPSQIGTFAPDVAFSGETTTDCKLLGPASSILGRNAIVDCLPERGRGERAVIIAAREPRETKTIFDIPIRPRETPLENAVMAAVAGQGGGPGSGAGNPMHLAMAPNGAPPPAGSIFDGATGWPSGGGGGGGIPPRLIPGGAGDNPPQGEPPDGDGPSGNPGPSDPPGNTPPGNNNTPPGDDGPPDGGPEDEIPPVFEIPDGTPDPIDPPDLVTPVPGALPLMLTGLLGFLFARRRKPAS